jgi:hypothetical protein
MKKFVILLAIVCLVSPAFGDDEEDYEERVLESSYHGLIKENETYVEITPLIKIDENVVCGFHIIKKNKEIPFQIELVNDLGIVKAKKSLNCEKRKTYKFEIAAVLCDGSHSKSANVHISVIDINEYSPTFLQPSYVTEVDEGRLYQEIIRIEATDKDCTPLYGDVCRYEILTKDQPFTINNEGSIRNTEPLSHKVSHNHILSIVAYDCAMKQSAPVMVNIRVRRVCEAHVMGIPERIDYVANSMESVSLFPKYHLELCDMQCKGEEMIIQSTVLLKTKHISFGCDRDVSKCMKDDMVDLLPRDIEWTKDLVYDEGAESVFHFDGTVGAVVPSSLVKAQEFASYPFSIVTMFRHRSSASSDKHTKEHIVCSADDHKMNRHHMALFVRNCRLILLLRKSFSEGDLNIFSPAEWRWKIPQVCDNEWHQYTVNVDLPKVELFIDGAKFEDNTEDRHSNPEVIDDWPLHAAHGINTTLSVGACFQGSEGRLKHGFSGDIAEIKMAVKRTLSPKEIACGNDCAERLLPPPEQYMESDQQIQSNTHMNEIVIEGTNKSNIEVLLQKVQYINTKENPTVGRRNIEILTTVSCPNKKAIRLPSIDTYIMVTQSPTTTSVHKVLADKPLTDDQKPQILITGSQNHLVSYPDIKDGVKILASINITIVTGSQVNPSLQKLDSCNVNVFPSLNPDHEEITLENNENLSPALDIKTSINKDGVEMVGYDTIDSYLRILKSLVYTNKKPAYYLNRVFKLSCSQIGINFRSAEYTLTLTVLHPKQQPTTPTPVEKVEAREHAESNVFAHAMVHTHDIAEPQAKIHNIIQKVQSSSHSTMLILVICSSFVLLICGIGIARLRNKTVTNLEKHQPCPKISDQQLDWDDSELTITINPMEQENLSDESSDSENSDSDDEEVMNGRYKNVSQLEWDNSTL